MEVLPSGSKIWRYQYLLHDRRREVTIGRYPEIGVADARDQHFEYRSLVARGLDPAVHRQEELQRQKSQAQTEDADENQFREFSKIWIRERLFNRSETYRKQTVSRLERFVWPEIGNKKLDDVRPVDVLRIIEARRSTPNTAESVRSIIQQIYNYAIQKLLVDTNPALPLRGVIEVPPPVHHRHLSEAELGAFWRSLNKQGAHYTTIAAAKLLMYSMCRKSEVVRAKWCEFDLENARWDIPAERMKSKRPHRVFLARQAVEVLEFMWLHSGAGEYVFPSTQRNNVPLADATLNHLFKRLDFGVPEFAPHGTRGTGATLLREHGFSRDVVELLLAHVERNTTTGSYHHHQLEPERRKALQYLADQIDFLARKSDG